MVEEGTTYYLHQVLQTYLPDCIRNNQQYWDLFTIATPPAQVLCLEADPRPGGPPALPSPSNLTVVPGVAR